MDAQALLQLVVTADTAAAIAALDDLQDSTDILTGSLATSTDQLAETGGAADDANAQLGGLADRFVVLGESANDYAANLAIIQDAADGAVGEITVLGDATARTADIMVDAAPEIASAGGAAAGAGGSAAEASGGFDLLGGSMLKTLAPLAAIFIGYEGAKSVFEDAKSQTNQWNTSQALLVQSLNNTKDAVGMTATQIDDLAKSTAKGTDFTDAANLSVADLLVTVNGMNSSTMPEAIELTDDMATRIAALKGQTSASAQQLAMAGKAMSKALSDPTAAASAFTRAGLALDAQQKSQLATWAASTNASDAEALSIQGVTQAGAEALENWNGLTAAQQTAAEAADGLTANQIAQAKAMGLMNIQASSQTQLMQILSGYIGGAASAAADTFSGKITQLKNSLAENLIPTLKQLELDLTNLAIAALPVLEAALKDVAGVVRGLTGFWKDLGKTGQQIIGDLALGLAAGGTLMFGLNKLFSMGTSIYKVFKNITALKSISSLANVITGGGVTSAGAGVATEAAEGAGVAGAAAGGGAEAAVGAGALAATPEIAGFGAALAAAAGPLALIAGAGIGTALVIHTLEQNSKNAAAAANTHATALQTEGQQALTAGGAHAEAAKNVAAHTKATQDNIAVQETLKQKEQDAKTATDKLATAHTAVTTALSKYGANSAQYQAAINAEASAIENNNTAQAALTKAQGDAKVAGQQVTDTTNNLNAAHLVLNQNLPKAAELHGKLAAAQSNQNAAASAVKEAQGQLNTAVQIFGDTSPAAVSAAKNLSSKQSDLASKTQSVHYWQDQINTLMQNSKTEFANYGGQIDSITGKANSAASALSAMEKGLQNVPAPKTGLSGLLSHFAGGTDYAPGGMALVGEEGPELVNLPQGSAVTPAGQTAAALAGGAGGGDVHITIQAGTVVGANGAQALAQLVWQQLQQISRANGFNGALPQIGIQPVGA